MNHIEAGNKIITEGWVSYPFLDDNDSSLWPHEIHHHEVEILDLVSIARLILKVCGLLEVSNKNICNKIPIHNFIYFLCESKFRIIIANKNTEGKLKYFKKIMKIVYDINGYDFYPKDEINDFKNYGLLF